MVAVMLLAVGTLKLPEVVFVLFLFAGQFKATPLFAQVPDVVDLTLLMALLTTIGVLHTYWLERARLAFDKRLIMAWLLFCWLMLASLLWTPSTTYGWTKVSHFIVLGTVVFFAPSILFTHKPRAVKRFFYAVVGFGVLYSLFAIQIGLATWSKLGFVLLPGSNYLGLGYVAGVTIVVALLYLMPGGGWSMFIGCAVIAVAGGALLLSGGRGPLVAVAVTLLVIAVLGLLTPGKISRTTAFLGVMLALVFAGLAQFDLLPQTIAYRLSLLQPEAIGQNVDSSAFARVQRWNAAAQALVNHPLLGVGSGGFAQWFLHQDVRDYPHNLFLEVSAELGLPGLLLVLYLFWVPLKAMLSAPNTVMQREARLLRGTALGLTIFALVNALVSGDLNDNRFVWMTSGLLMAVSARQGDRDAASQGSA